MDIPAKLPEPVRRVESLFEHATAGYSDQPQPLGAYLSLMGVFGAFVSGLAGAMWFSKAKLPEKPKPGEIFLLGVAAHKLAVDHQGFGDGTVARAVRPAQGKRGRG